MKRCAVAIVCGSHEEGNCQSEVLPGHNAQAGLVSFESNTQPGSSSDAGILTARSSKKNSLVWRVRGGLPAFAHEPAKTKMPEQKKDKTNLRKKKLMQTNESVKNLKNHTSTVIAAFGFLSMVLAVSQAAQAQIIQPAGGEVPAVFQAAGPDAASIQSSVDAFRAALGDNNLNNPG